MDHGHSALARSLLSATRPPTVPDAPPLAHCYPLGPKRSARRLPKVADLATLVMQISLVDEGRRVVPIVYYADGGGLYEGAAATAALP